MIQAYDTQPLCGCATASPPGKVATIAAEAWHKSYLARATLGEVLPHRGGMTRPLHCLYRALLTFSSALQADYLVGLWGYHLPLQRLGRLACLGRGLLWKESGGECDPSYLSFSSRGSLPRLCRSSFHTAYLAHLHRARPTAPRTRCAADACASRGCASRGARNQQIRLPRSTARARCSRRASYRACGEERRLVAIRLSRGARACRLV